MKRKIIKLGTATLVVSLPNKWIKRMKLNQGDEIDVNEQENNLIIGGSRKEIAGKSAKIKLTTPEKFMGRYIHTPYRFGYDKLEINFEDVKVLPLIQQYLDELLGFEMVDQTANGCTIQMVAKGMEEEFDKILRRTFLILLTMTEEIPQAIKDKNIQNLEELAALEKMINKLTNFCQRLLNKQFYTDTANTNFLFCLTWTLEQIADELRDMCRIAQSKETINKNLIQLLEKFRIFFREFYNNYYDKKDAKLLSLRNQTKKILEESNKQLSASKNNTERKILFYIISLTNKINHLNISLI